MSTSTPHPSDGHYIKIALVLRRAHGAGDGAPTSSTRSRSNSTLAADLPDAGDGGEVRHGRLVLHAPEVRQPAVQPPVHQRDLPRRGWLQGSSLLTFDEFFWMSPQPSPRRSMLLRGRFGGAGFYAARVVSPKAVADQVAHRHPSPGRLVRRRHPCSGCRRLPDAHVGEQRLHRAHGPAPADVSAWVAPWVFSLGTLTMASPGRRWGRLVQAVPPGRRGRHFNVVIVACTGRRRSTPSPTVRWTMGPRARRRCSRPDVDAGGRAGAHASRRRCRPDDHLVHDVDRADGAVGAADLRRGAAYSAYVSPADVPVGHLRPADRRLLMALVAGFYSRA